MATRKKTTRKKASRKAASRKAGGKKATRKKATRKTAAKKSARKKPAKKRTVKRPAARKTTRKQSARTGRTVFMEREAERDKRLSIVFDNAVGELADKAAERRFERLVSEAASSAVHHLEHGYEVQLVTRDEVLPFGRGRAHRLRILEVLALIGPHPREAIALRGPEPGPLEFRPATEPVAL